MPLTGKLKQRDTQLHYLNAKIMLLKDKKSKKSKLFFSQEDGILPIVLLSGK